MLHSLDLLSPSSLHQPPVQHSRSNLFFSSHIWISTPFLTASTTLRPPSPLHGFPKKEGSGAGPEPGHFTQGPELRLAGLQGLVRRGETLSPPRLHRKLLLRVAGDRDPAVSQHPERDPEGEAAVLGLQSGASELGRRRSAVAGCVRC